MNSGRQPSGGCDAVIVNSGIIQLLLTGGIGRVSTLYGVKLVKL